jgi:hypothetical protein
VTLGAQGTTPVGSVIVGVVIDVWSPRAALVLGAVACVLGAGLLAGVTASPAAAPDDVRRPVA